CARDAYGSGTDFW
nr:immunoglobulin heavy chain junction region [Macaca mulatta]MOV54107.1 immunoglobulin heavy chain junction region [Macaca mulatta]MOV54149.1 immunoglobulin heavy chain junction region [Macaca mulatta]MOV54153.1 immunoglobulin heavy chain junction region [Macaca mulatta]MOV55439.1 immunoglobulin heavy chain junction region [Macaca mulatta]